MSPPSGPLSPGLFRVSLILLALAIGLSLIFSVSWGQARIPFEDAYRILVTQWFSPSGTETPSAWTTIVWNLRLPRALAAVLIGMGLALCGTIMQAAVQNPLADPYVLGISSGATLGATFAILVGFSSLGWLAVWGVSMGAFAGALAASVLVLALAGVGGRVTSSKLILSGMVVNAMLSAFSSMIIYFSNNSQGLRNVTFWIMGSLAGIHWDDLPLLGSVVILCCLFFLTQSRILNTMLVGEEAATTLGVPLGLFRTGYLALTALLTGVLVSQSGMVGFVGLIVPHIARSLVGSHHGRLLPLSVLLGGLFMLWTDLIARSMIPGTELPVGIVTAAVGAPTFMYLLLRRNYEFGRG